MRIVTAGDSAVVVELEERIDPAVNARAITLAESVQSAALGGVRDVVPTFRSVTVQFDPLRTDYDALLALIETAAARPPAPAIAGRTPIRIPVCYGGELGPDLSEVAAFAGSTEREVIDRHASRTYRVFALGFVAGFAYLGTVDESIAMPRHATPRLRVPAGSVGIAGVQTGVYPAETPGGWRLIGRTPIKPFDLSRPDPFLLKAGDSVQFFAIDRDAFDTWSARRQA
ncbi:MAG TPA: 5-oxoprolinase subunit PxpB [Vicinamibacterales bacterium]|nr:5-oxoprolinase subunit PxpB [Vicinamibacterales bacterium]